MMGRNHVEGGPSAKKQSYNEENNPCWKEHNQSLKCLSDSNYDHDACTTQFLNYRTCREFWTEVQRLRRLKGITPRLPNLEERNKIKDMYKKTGKIEVEV